MIRTEVAIVGAGPAGSTCARQLYNAGVDCLLLDKAEFPRAKPCAGWIIPAVVDDLNLNPQNYPFSLTTFRRFQVSVKGVGIKLPVRQYAIRRVEFDDWLVRICGIPLTRHLVKHIQQVDDDFIIDGKYHARYLVGAGGTYCPVRRALFNQGPDRRLRDQVVALEEEFLYPGADEICRLWFLENGLPGYSWFVPKAGGYVNAGLGGMALDLKRRNDDIIRHWRLFTEKLARLGLVQGHDWQPAAHTYYVRYPPVTARRGNAFLTGDAAGLATPDMGEGISAAIRSGLNAARSIITGDDYALDNLPGSSIRTIVLKRT